MNATRQQAIAELKRNRPQSRLLQVLGFTGLAWTTYAWLSPEIGF